MADDDDAKAVADLKHAQDAAEYRVAAKRYIDMQASFLRALEAADGALEGLEDAHKALRACVDGMIGSPRSGRADGLSNAGEFAGDYARRHLFRAASVYNGPEDQHGGATWQAAVTDELRIMTAVELVRRGTSKRGAIARVFGKSGEQGKNSAEFKRMERVLNKQLTFEQKPSSADDLAPLSGFRLKLVDWLVEKTIDADPERAALSFELEELDAGADNIRNDHDDYSASDLAGDD